jgi:hypothetical protein
MEITFDRKMVRTLSINQYLFGRFGKWRYGTDRQSAEHSPWYPSYGLLTED